MPNPNQTQLQIIQDDKKYTKYGLKGGAVTGIIIGATATEGAVVGGVLGAPFGGVGAIPGAIIGSIAGLIVGIFTGGVSGKVVDRVVRKEIYDLTVEQAELRQHVNFLLHEYRQFRNEQEELQTQNTHLKRRTDEALSSVKSCSSSTHRMLRMSITNSVPEEIICPITNLIFRDPVTLKLRQPDGTFCHKTYEREAIKEWKNTCQTNGRNFHDPVTRLPVVSDPQNVPTDEFKEEMAKRFLRRYPEYYCDQQERRRNEILPSLASQLTF